MTEPVDHAPCRRTIKDIDIPELQRGCGSWIVTRNDTGAVVCEIFAQDRRKLKLFWADAVTIRTALDYLVALNMKGIQHDQDVHIAPISNPLYRNPAEGG